MTGLCRGCVLGTFSTLKSGMSPIILAVGANVPTYLRFVNGNITEVTPEKLPMSPYFSMAWVICPHFSKALAEHCNEHDENYAFEFIGTYYPKDKVKLWSCCSQKHWQKPTAKLSDFSLNQDWADPIPNGLPISKKWGLKSTLLTSFRPNQQTESETTEPKHRVALTSGE